MRAISSTENANQTHVFEISHLSPSEIQTSAQKKYLNHTDANVLTSYASQSNIQSKKKVYIYHIFPDDFYQIEKAVI